MRRRSHRLGAFRNGRAKSRQRLHSFLPPVRATEPLRRDGVPAHRFFAVAGFLIEGARLERHHGVVRLLKQFVQFACGVRARTRPAYSSLYLPPITHEYGIVSVLTRETPARAPNSSFPRQKCTAPCLTAKNVAS